MAKDGVGWYLDQIGRYPLLTPAEEIHLGQLVQAMQRLKVDNPDGPYSKEQTRIIRAGRKAHHRMVCANLRLVVNVSKKYAAQYQNGSLLDLIQEGAKGLTRAVEKFDPTLGYKFSTYAFWWIRQSVQRSLILERTIYLPNGCVDKIKHLRDYIADHHQRTGKLPTLSQMAENVPMRVVDPKQREQAILDLMPHLMELRSLDGAVDGLETKKAGKALLAFVPGESTDCLEELERAEDDELLYSLLEHPSMPEELRYVIEQRFGLGPLLGQPVSFHEIGRHLGISRGRAKTLFDQAMRRLRYLARTHTYPEALVEAHDDPATELGTQREKPCSN